MTNYTTVFALTLSGWLGFSACSQNGAELTPKLTPASDTIVESGWNDFSKPIISHLLYDFANFSWDDRKATRESNENHLYQGSLYWGWFELTKAPNDLIKDSAKAFVWQYLTGDKNGNEGEFDCLANEFFQLATEEDERDPNTMGITEHLSTVPFAATAKTFTIECFKDGYYGGAGTRWETEYGNFDVETGKKLTLEDLVWHTDSVYMVAERLFYGAKYKANDEHQQKFKTMVYDFAIQNNNYGLLLVFSTGPIEMFITLPYASISKFLKPKYWYLLL